MKFSPIVALYIVLAGTTLAGSQPTCVECHDVDAEAFAATVHGFLECSDCHAGTEDVPHGDEAGRPDCAVCHDDVAEEYAESAHGSALAEGTTEAPGCEACHGAIHVLQPGTSVDSPVHPLRLPQTCGRCHADPDVVRKFGIPVAFPIAAYEASVHATACAAGLEAATCSSCHGSHGIFSAADSRSLVNHQRVSETCGACHEEISAVYAASVHGKAAAHGAREAPVCTDCHGEHRILSPLQTASPVFATNVPKMTCGRCHGDLRLNEKYGMTGEQVSAYVDSYHGLASRSGKLTVAHCGSCHGVHDILPSSDPASHVHQSNLSETCGHCHAGAGERFAIGQVHVLATDRAHPAVYFVRLGYLWIIFLTIGAMVLHNLADLYRKARSPMVRPLRSGRPEEIRLSGGFRMAHATLVLSFVVLVYTGFALTYPEALWAAPLLRWEESLGLRGWLHRAAALVMILGLAIHVVHLAIDRRARSCIAHMRPGREDWVEFRERMRYFMGRRPTPPHSPWVGYPEKLEYLALLWGLAVMAVTGFLLWFDDLALRWLPKWVTDVATVIHFYEAVLASLAILVWHLYFVIFDPVVYPMDSAWLTGRSAPARQEEREPPPVTKRRAPSRKAS